MGNNKSKTIYKSYETHEAFNTALRNSGLEKCNLLFAIDFTKSNLSQGTNTFNGKSLHYIKDQEPHNDILESPPPYNRVVSIGKTLTFHGITDKEKEQNKSLLNQLNPYQWALSVSGSQLESFDDDHLIPTCIFGYARSSIEPYVKEIYDSNNDIRGCHGIDGVIEAYENSVRNIGLSGNTQFAPIIEWALQKVSQNYEYHVLVIIGDGCIEDLERTKECLKKACSYPLSVIFIGVGDGSNPDKKDKWKSMRDLDDNPTGNVDNWQSVYLTNIKDNLEKSPRPDLEFAVHLFSEIPEQYKYFKKFGLIKN